MSFRFNTAPASNNNNASSSDNAQWKAQAFLNLWIKRPDGSRAKIGAIALREQKNFEKALIARLQEEGALDALHQALEIDFQMADRPVTTADVGF